MNIQEVRQKYPQYSDLSDEQLGKALHGKFYADMPYEQFAAKTGLTPAAAEPEGPGMLSQLARQAGLTVRAPVSAALAIPAALGDAVTGGRSTPAVTRVLDALFPTPTGGTERFSQDVAGAMAGGGALAQATKTMPTILQQVLAAGGGAAGAGGAREGGFGPVGQIVGGIAGGVVAPSSVTAATEGSKAVLRGAKALVDPFTEAGRKNIVARTMQSQAKDPRAAAESIGKAQELVPGSVPTTAEASGDTGLASLQKAVRNQSPANFADRAAQQDAARQAYLDKVFGANVREMEIGRDAATAPMREAAFEAAGNKKINTKPAITVADSILKSGAGKRQEVEKAMGWAKSRIEGETNAQRLDAIRQDINDIIAGKMDRDPEKASFRLASKELASVRGRLVEAINERAPLYKEYLKEYGEQSVPISKQVLGKDIRASATNNMTERLSTPKLANQMVNRADEIGETMGSQESDVLYRLLQDMRRSAAPEAAMRTAGSDTLQNLVGANMLKRAGVGQGGPFGKITSGLLGKLYSPLEDQTQGLLTRGMLEPQMGMELLTQKLAENPKLAEELLRRLLVTPGAGLLGGAIAQ